MKKKYELSAYADQKITLMAVDSEGGYYTESGNRGLLRDLDYFEESPEKISFVFDSMTDNQSEMVFLNRLPEPIYLQNGEKETSILYFGIAQDMEQLNPYFNCDAYNGNNSVYVLDDNGSKLFNSNQVELIKGHNVFSVLQNMKYLHNSSFEKTKAELEEKGCLSGSCNVCCYEYIKTCQFCHDIYRYLYGYGSLLCYAGNFFYYAQKPTGSKQIQEQFSCQYVS